MCGWKSFANLFASAQILPAVWFKKNYIRKNSFSTVHFIRCLTRQYKIMRQNTRSCTESDRFYEIANVMANPVRILKKVYSRKKLVFEL